MRIWLFMITVVSELIVFVGLIILWFLLPFIKVYEFFTYATTRNDSNEIEAEPDYYSMKKAALQAIEAEYNGAEYDGTEYDIDFSKTNFSKDTNISYDTKKQDIVEWLERIEVFETINKITPVSYYDPINDPIRKEYFNNLKDLEGDEFLRGYDAFEEFEKEQLFSNN